MDILEVMKKRHSVRSYLDKPIEKEKKEIIESFANELNQKSGLDITIHYDEPKCFDSLLGHYGKFNGVKNYISIKGKRGRDLEEITGYYGEQLVLKIQELGLNTCWVVATHGKSVAKVKKGHKESCVISFGYGETQGHSHKGKPITTLVKDYDNSPDWFKRGCDACIIAPTAVHQQKFYLYLENETPYVKCFLGFHSRMDIGIIKCHFELATNKKLIEK